MTTKARLAYLRSQIEAEQISYSEIAELQGLAEHIDPSDVVLLEWAGVPEFPEVRERIPFEVFEVALVAELPVADGPSTECERLLSRHEILAVGEEAVGFLFTVYGWRPDGPGSNLSVATAISDFPAEGPDDPKARKAAQDLAYALADGKPVQDNTDILDA